MTVNHLSSLTFIIWI